MITHYLPCEHTLRNIDVAIENYKRFMATKHVVTRPPVGSTYVRTTKYHVDTNPIVEGHQNVRRDTRPLQSEDKVDPRSEDERYVDHVVGRMWNAIR